MSKPKARSQDLTCSSIMPRASRCVLHRSYSWQVCKVGNVVQIQTILQNSQDCRELSNAKDRLGWGGDTIKQCSSLMEIGVPLEELDTPLGVGTGCLVAMARQLEVPRFERLVNRNMFRFNGRLNWSSYISCIGLDVFGFPIGLEGRRESKLPPPESKLACLKCY